MYKYLENSFLKTQDKGGGDQAGVSNITEKNEPPSEPESDQLPSGTAAGGWRAHEASSSAAHRYTWNTTDT